MTYFPLMPFTERAAEVRAEIVDPDTLSLYDRTIASIEIEAVRALQEEYRDQLTNFDPIGIYKYADLPFWILRAVWRVERLKFGREPLAILDIGAGGCHFGAVAQVLGHSIVGTDIAVPLYADIAKALGVTRLVTPVVRGEPMLQVGGPFDLITIVWQVFDFLCAHPDGSRDYWSISDWVTFFRDLAENHCTPNAAIHLHLNPEIQKDRSQFNAELLDYCEQRGAVVDRSIGIVDVAIRNLLVDAPQWSRRHRSPNGRSALPRL